MLKPRSRAVRRAGRRQPSRSVRCLGSGTVVSVLLLAGPFLLAQAPPSSTSIDIAVSRVIAAATCAPEAVALDGQLHVTFHTFVPPGEGKRTTAFVEMRTVNAIGAESAAAYELDNRGRQPQEYPCGPGEPCLQAVFAPFDLVRAGEGRERGAPGGFLIKVAAVPDGGIVAGVADVKFTCPQ